MKRPSLWLYCIVLLGSILAEQTSAQPIFYTAAKPEAFDALVSDDNVEVVKEEDAYWGWLPTEKIETKNVGFIYHPGAFYDERAYTPILRALAEEGYPSFLLDVPLSLSIMTPFRADLVIREFPEIETWVVGGHSLGGAGK